MPKYSTLSSFSGMTNYIDDVVFRQQIEKQLTKIENVNRFSKAIFFGNSGEYFYANKEEQDIASNSLTLIQNSIICSSRFIRTGCRSDSDSFKVEIF